jgi:formylmethanofuran dehydrogenase subunit E
VKNLQYLLDQSAARHHHLCPRQVLGVRMGMLAGKVLGLDLPQVDKRLFAFVECDGCGNGGISVATGCWVDRRTLRVMDYGKLAATFVDTQSGRAIRIWPKPESRGIAEHNGADELDHWHRQLEAYQVLPDDELFTIQPVQLAVALEKIISQPGLRVNCEACGEEITNEREVWQNGKVLCRACAGERYYAPIDLVMTQPEGLEIAPDSTGREKATVTPEIPVVSLIGRSGAGKTSLMEKLVQELTGRGYRLATIKHHSHAGFEIDVPGKDSWRFAQAGSRHVTIAAPDKIASYHLLERPLDLDEITEGISGVDLILVEGYKQANKPAIEVVRAANSTELVCNSTRRIAVAADFPLNLGVPQFGLDEAAAIADLIEGLFLRLTAANIPGPPAPG